MITKEHTAVLGGGKDPCASITEMPGQERCYAAGISDSVQASACIAKLSPRETEVLHRIARNQSTKAIAGDLAISPKTVECHRAQVMRKMGCRTLFDLGRLWGLASAASPSLEGPDRPQGSIALRTAFATVDAFGQSSDSSHLLQIDHLTQQQLRDRAHGDREDAQRAILNGSVAAAAMLFNDAERCEQRAKVLERVTAVTPLPRRPTNCPAA